MRSRRETAPGLHSQSGRDDNTPRPQTSTAQTSRQWDFVGTVEMGLAAKLPVGDFGSLDLEAARLEGS